MALFLAFWEWSWIKSWHVLKWSPCWVCLRKVWNICMFLLLPLGGLVKIVSISFLSCRNYLSHSQNRSKWPFLKFVSSNVNLILWGINDLSSQPRLVKQRTDRNKLLFVLIQQVVFHREFQNSFGSLFSQTVTVPRAWLEFRKNWSCWMETLPGLYRKQ